VPDFDPTDPVITPWAETIATELLDATLFPEDRDPAALAGTLAAALAEVDVARQVLALLPVLAANALRPEGPLVDEGPLGVAPGSAESPALTAGRMLLAAALDDAGLVGTYVAAVTSGPDPLQAAGEVMAAMLATFRSEPIRHPEEHP
jgi:hypothetical protein